MATTYTVPGKGPVETFSVVTSPESSVDFASLKKNGFAVAERDVRLQGTLPSDFQGDLLVTHRGAETTLSERERAKELRGNKFDVKAHLMRGRNTFLLASSRTPDDVFLVDVFYRSTTREWVESILKALVLVLIVKTFVVQAFFIPTESMQSTLLVGDYLLVDKVTYLFRNPRPGDIVVFQYPRDPSKDFIKRCVAAAGDRISHDADKLTYNGKPLREPYTQYVDHDSSGRPIPEQVGDQRNFPEFTVPPGTIFMMGDNRNNSQDSRFWGPLPLWRVKGKAWAGYWPLNRLGLIRHEFGTPE